jgi:hypothetical protein
MAGDQDDDDLIDDDLEWEDDEAVDSEELTAPKRVAVAKQRDWRDLERFKAERELKKLMEADNWLDDL